MDLKESMIKCQRCGKEQAIRSSCINCDKEFPEIRIAVKEVEVVKEIYVDKIVHREIPIFLNQEVIVSALCPACLKSHHSYVNDPVDVCTFAEMEEKLIKRALSITASSIEAAKLLGIGKITLYRKIKELGIPLIQKGKNKVCLFREQPNNSENPDTPSRTTEPVKDVETI